MGQFTKNMAADEVPLCSVSISDPFWDRQIELVQSVVIPYQWEVLNDRVPEAEPSHAIMNLKIAAGIEKGDFNGFFFQDTDLYKWLEAVAYSLTIKEDKELEKLADDAIELIGKAQCEDGYLNTFVQIREPEKRFTNLEECHELYTAGHMIEAGVAYYQATGKKAFLDIVSRFADYIDSRFGVEEGKIHGYDGHQEVELALVRLYKATGEERYRKLAKYFLDARGTEPFYLDEEWEKRGKISYWTQKEISAPKGRAAYFQAHKPVREQTEAVGHAVRQVYMLTGMADIASLYGEEAMKNACVTLWNNIVKKQMYITGGIGSTGAGEAFTYDYDLPNDTIYSETCASIGLIFFAQRMLLMENNRCYSDVIEKALFNVIMSSMAKDGKHYFYVNPLEVEPKASRKSPIKGHVKPVRQKWFGCACCPPNLARLLTSLRGYIYTASEDTLYIHQYIGSEVTAKLNSKEVKASITSEYPWDETVTIRLHSIEAENYKVAVRIPGWCRKAELTVDGEAIDLSSCMENGYAVLSRRWSKEAVLILTLSMPVEEMQANPNVRNDLGKVAIQRGPLVYCLEEVDNGANLPAISLAKDPDFTVKKEEILDGILSISAKGVREEEAGWEDALYLPYSRKTKDVTLKAVPYYSWGNRGEGEMLVWIRKEI